MSREDMPVRGTKLTEDLPSVKVEMVLERSRKALYLHEQHASGTFPDGKEFRIISIIPHGYGFELKHGEGDWETFVMTPRALVNAVVSLLQSEETKEGGEAE